MWQRASNSHRISVSAFQYYSASVAEDFFFHFTLLLSEGRAGKYNVLPDVGNAARESIPALNFTTASSKFSRIYCKCVYSL